MMYLVRTSARSKAKKKLKNNVSLLFSSAMKKNETKNCKKYNKKYRPIANKTTHHVHEDVGYCWKTTWYNINRVFVRCRCACNRYGVTRKRADVYYRREAKGERVVYERVLKLEAGFLSAATYRK